MSKKWILPAALAVCVAGLMAADFFAPDRSFSSRENRMLSQKPLLSVKSLADGSFMEQYEDYVTDQFPGRDAFISIKTQVQKSLGKKDVNGVYFAPDNTLVERHAPESVDEERAGRRAARMAQQAAQIKNMIPGRVAVMLVPSASAVQKQRLPDFAVEFDQYLWIKGVEKSMREAGASVVEAFDALDAHGEEQVYYGTDHHWTSLGAFYGYQAFAEAFDLGEVSPEDYDRRVVKDDFLGTLEAKVNLPVRPDEIEIFIRKGEAEHPVRFVYEEKQADSCYFYDRLQTKDAYAFFMDGNYPVTELAGEGAPDRSIMLIKDSFANCFAPFLTRDYGTVWLVDPRYYRGDVTALVEEYEPTDVLYLFNVFQFMEHF